MNDPSQLDLRDIHLPPDPAWWPPALGWWLLLIALLAIAVVGYLRWRRYRAERVRRLALAELEALAARCVGAPERVPAELSIWLRRVALSIAGRAGLAGVTGKAWLQALEGLGPRSRLTREYTRWIVEGPYAPQGTIAAEELDGLYAACREWTANLELER